MSQGYKIRIFSGNETYGYLEDTFSREMAESICNDLEWFFLDEDGNRWDLEIVEAV